MKLLLAEDGSVNQMVATKMLEERGHEVTLAENGTEALDILETQSFDVVLMDVQMPVMNGFDATVAIREKEKGTGNHLPIIAMTANAMKGDREACLAAGMVFVEGIRSGRSVRTSFCLVFHFVYFSPLPRFDSKVSV
jgi:CheY-like chemotaxis protein